RRASSGRPPPRAPVPTSIRCGAESRTGPSSPPWLRGGGPNLRRKTGEHNPEDHLTCGLDPLIEAEDVLGVVRRLHPSEPVQTRAVVRPRPVLELGVGEVRVHTAW